MSPLLLPFSLMEQGKTYQLADLHGIFPYCGVQDESIGKVTPQQLFGIIILGYKDCEVDKTRHYLFRCTGKDTYLQI